MVPPIFFAFGISRHRRTAPSRMAVGALEPMTAGPVARNRYKLRHPDRNWGKRKPGANAFMSVVDPQASLVFDGDVLHEVEALVANFSTPHSSAARVAPGTVETADRNARHWISAEVGALRAGSEAHKRAMCTM